VTPVHAESGVTHWLVQISSWSVRAVGIVWLGTAIWFAARRPTTFGGKAVHFFRTLLPEPWLLLCLVILILGLFLVPAWVWSPLLVRVPVLRPIGAVVVTVSAALMIWARFALGDMWAGRPMVQEHHELRTGGPYQLVRHPIYTGMIGVALGYTLLLYFGAMIPVLLLVVAWLGWRVRVEDRLMVATFGDRYREYQKRVRALIPLPRRVPEATERPVRTR
jgi:protein-S-isoprenylcysteine O-methyltransferase Ste14